MIQVQVIPINDRGKNILKNNTDKFGISKFQSRMIKKVGDRFTTTEIIPEPFSIIITVKAEYEKYVNKNIIYDKTVIAVEKIMMEHDGSLHDVSIEVKDES
jgi:hypothetical protein